jgi:hypothetical protein
LLLAAAAIMGSVLLVKDYFATKSDVAILKCQLHAEIELTDSRVRIAESTRKLVTLNHDLARLATPKPVSEFAAKLGMDIHKETAALTAQTTRETEAEARLRSGSCQDEGSRVSRSAASRA